MLPRLLKRLAPKIGASVLIEPEWGVAGRIRFRNGRYSYFRYNTLDLNPVGASDVAKDKDYAAFFMRALGYPAVRGKAFFSDDWCETIGSERDAEAGGGG
ncbi:MAG: cyanophycin synthetase, partial [Patescibacteria group bacterium]|nr:cyanophycin synthetase [Patescibacteria group bacterium]